MSEVHEPPAFCKTGLAFPPTGLDNNIMYPTDFALALGPSGLPLMAIPDLLSMGQDGYSEDELLGLRKEELLWVVRNLRERLAESLGIQLKLENDLEAGTATRSEVEASAATSRWLLDQTGRAENVLRRRFPRVNVPTLQDVLISTIDAKAPYSHVSKVTPKSPLNRTCQPILQLRGRSLFALKPKEFWTKTETGLFFYEYFAGGIPTESLGMVPPLHCFINCRDTCGRYFYLEGGPQGESLVGSVIFDQWDESPGAIPISFPRLGQFIGDAVEILKSSAEIFPKGGDTPYFFLGPNSNTYIAQALVRAGLPVRAPLGAIGWAYYDQGLEHPKNLKSIAGYPSYVNSRLR